MNGPLTPGTFTARVPSVIDTSGSDSMSKVNASCAASRCSVGPLDWLIPGRSTTTARPLHVAWALVVWAGRSLLTAAPSSDGGPLSSWSSSQVHSGWPVSAL